MSFASDNEVVLNNWEDLVSVSGISIAARTVQSSNGDDIDIELGDLSSLAFPEQAASTSSVFNSAVIWPSDLAPYDPAVIELCTQSSQPSSLFGYGRRVNAAASDSAIAANDELTLGLAFNSFATRPHLHPRSVANPPTTAFAAPGQKELVSQNGKTNSIAAAVLRAHSLDRSSLAPACSLPGPDSRLGRRTTARSNGAALSSWAYSACGGKAPDFVRDLQHPDCALLPFLSEDAVKLAAFCDWHKTADIAAGEDSHSSKLEVAVRVFFNTGTVQSFWKDYTFALSVFETAMHTPSFLALHRLVLRNFFLSGRVNCNEFVLFQGLVRWARYRLRAAQLPDTDPRLLRLELHDLLPFIRWTSMTTAEIAVLTTTHPSRPSLFTYEERMTLRELKAVAAAADYSSNPAASFALTQGFLYEQSYQRSPPVNAATEVGGPLPASAMAGELRGPPALPMPSGTAQGVTHAVGMRIEVQYRAAAAPLPSITESITALAAGIVDEISVPADAPVQPPNSAVWRNTLYSTPEISMPLSDYLEEYNAVAIASFSLPPTAAMPQGGTCAHETTGPPSTSSAPCAGSGLGTAGVDASTKSGAVRLGRSPAFTETFLDSAMCRMRVQVLLGSLIPAVSAPPGLTPEAATGATNTSDAAAANVSASILPCSALDALTVVSCITPQSAFFCPRVPPTLEIEMQRASSNANEMPVVCNAPVRLHKCYQIHVMNIAVLCFFIILPALLIANWHLDGSFSPWSTWPIPLMLFGLPIGLVCIRIAQTERCYTAPEGEFGRRIPLSAAHLSALTLRKKKPSLCCVRTRGGTDLDNTVGHRNYAASSKAYFNCSEPEGWLWTCADRWGGSFEDAWVLELLIIGSAVVLSLPFLFLFFQSVGVATLPYVAYFVPVYVFFFLICCCPCAFAQADPDRHVFELFLYGWLIPWAFIGPLLAFTALLHAKLIGAALSTLEVFAPFFVIACFIIVVWRFFVREQDNGCFTFVSFLSLAPFLLWVILLGLYANKQWHPTTLVYAPSLIVANIPLFFYLGIMFISFAYVALDIACKNCCCSAPDTEGLYRSSSAGSNIASLFPPSQSKKRATAPA